MLTGDRQAVFRELHVHFVVRAVAYTVLQSTSLYCGSGNTTILSCCIGSRTRLRISPIFDRLMSRMPGKLETLQTLPPVRLRITSRSKTVILFRSESAGEPLREEDLPRIPAALISVVIWGCCSNGAVHILNQSSPGPRSKRWSTKNHEKQTPGVTRTV